MSKKKKKNRPANIKDVAKKAGVSISTVSRVINQTVPVANDKYQRVQDAIQELNFQPKTAARRLRSQKTNTIGLLLPVISGDFIASMLHGIERGVIEGDYELLIHSTFFESRSDSPFRRVLGEHNTDGLIVFSDSLDERELRRLSDLDFPVVLLHRSSPEDLNMPSVTVENKNGTKQLIEHLIKKHGRKRIAYLRGPDGHEDTHWRDVGYRQALEANEISFDPSLIGTGNYNAHDATVAINSMIVDGFDFDAVFAGDDEAASGVLRALHLSNIRVPEDVSVVGFDDGSLAAHMIPALTTVNAQVEITGYTAAKQLIKVIQHGEADPIVLLPTQLILRRSCGCNYE
jgi:LacI family transcriptional regulator